MREPYTLKDVVVCSLWGGLALLYLFVAIIAVRVVVLGVADLVRSLS